MKTYNRTPAVFDRRLPRDWHLEPEPKESPWFVSVVFVACALTAIAAYWLLF